MSPLSYRYLYLLVVVTCNAQLLPYADEDIETRYELGLYKNLEEVLNIFKCDSNPISKEILKAYHTECLYTEDQLLPEGRRPPFIVVEGNHRPSKDSISAKLASVLDGRYITQVVPCLRRFSSQLRGGSPLRRPLQFLSLYASAFEARVQMTLDRPVVVNGYWTEQLAYSVTRSFHRGALPPATADFLDYPEDLMVPDFHIFLDFSETLYTTTPATLRFYQISNSRKTTNMKKRKTEVYRHLQGKLPIHIHELQRVSNRATALQLLETIKANLSGTRDFGLRPNVDYDYS